MKLKTVNIRGKEYVEVNERIRAFREIYPLFSLESKIIEATDEVAFIQAIVKNESGRIISMGTAYESRGSSNVNKTSHIENCETSAWGRALGNLGIGISDSVATADEVTRAIAKQKEENAEINIGSLKANLEASARCGMAKLKETWGNASEEEKKLVRDQLEYYKKLAKQGEKDGV
jgi:uncharacterized Fe-S center protein